MNFPDNIFYHIEHTWLKVTDTVATIGITDFAQKELGEIVYVDLPNVGTNFDQDEVFGSVEAIKTVSDLFCPASGKVIEVNTALNDEPTVVNTDPFESGWIIKIALSNPAELNVLMNSAKYRNKVE